MTDSPKAASITPFRRPMSEQERNHCRVDLHKTQMGSMTSDDFVIKWGDRLDVLLDPR